MYLYEHIIASHYHWSLNDIRQMDLQDFYIHLRICLVREDIEREFSAKLAGANFGDSNSGHIIDKGDGKVVQRQQLRSGAVKETRNQSSKLRNEVGGMKIDMKTGKVVNFNQPELSD